MSHCGIVRGHLLRLRAAALALRGPRLQQEPEVGTRAGIHPPRSGSGRQSRSVALSEMDMLTAPAGCRHCWPNIKSMDLPTIRARFEKTNSEQAALLSRSQEK